MTPALADATLRIGLQLFSIPKMLEKNFREGIAFVAGHALDIVRGIAVGRPGHAVEHALDLVETKQEGTRKRRNPGHGLKAL